MTKSDITKAIFGVFCLFALIGVYVYEFPYLINTLNLQSLFIWVVPIVIAMTIVLWLKFIRQKNELYEQFVLVVCSLVLGLMVFPALLSGINRVVLTENNKKEQFPLVEWSARSAQPYGIIDSTAIAVDGYQLIIKYNGADESIMLKDRSSFEIKNESVVLPINKGILGLVYVANN